MRNINRLESPYLPFVQTQELAAGREIVVDNIEDFAVGSLCQSHHGNCIGAVVDVSKGYYVRSAKMQEYAKRADSYAAMNGFVARAVNNAGSDGHTGNIKLLTILTYDLVLFEFCNAVSFAPKLGPSF